MIDWHDEPLGVMHWSGASDSGAYVLRISRREDLPLSFEVFTKVGKDIPDPPRSHESGSNRLTPGALFFDRQEGWWVESGVTPGIQDIFIPGLKSHRHPMGMCVDATHPDAIRWWCDVCDAFAWKPR